MLEHMWHDWFGSQQNAPGRRHTRRDIHDVSCRITLQFRSAVRMP